MEGLSSRKPYDKNDEKYNLHEDLDGLLEYTFITTQFSKGEFDDIYDDDSKDLDEDAIRFYKLVHDAQQEKEYENEDTCLKCGLSGYKKREVPKSKRKLPCKSVAFEDVKWLSRWPNTAARRFSAFVINGYKFVVESCQRKTQNYCVVVTSSTTRFRSQKDENPEVENVVWLF
ncbi:hypothetical protein MTR_7g028920 [Medicago truncatula]|uniref:Uncharacterized protein n=1 Tax=Medicago truncatula TaxID=3880 RepID=A0A072TX41_MEDTR|nr:hypothetical protein MTR_7g028920 [Medicago truncatula]